MDGSTKELIIIIPVFEDNECARLLIENLAKCCTTPPYIVVVEDGSVRNPLPVSAISDAGLSGEVVYLARNMGHQKAIAAGITLVAGQYKAKAIVIMDSDGEDRPESVAPLLDRLRTDDVDAVVAERRRRSESLRFRLFYSVYRFLFQVMTGRLIRFGNFIALSMRAVKRMAAMQEIWIHVPASLIISQLRIGKVATDRGNRYTGRSQMNFISLALHGLRSMMVFADDVLIRVGSFCMLLAALSIILLVVPVALKVSGFATPGWFTAATGLLILILMQAGILTFVLLMISGLTRSALPISEAALKQIIDHIEKTAPLTMTSAEKLGSKSP